MSSSKQKSRVHFNLIDSETVCIQFIREMHVCLSVSRMGMNENTLLWKKIFWRYPLNRKVNIQGSSKILYWKLTVLKWVDTRPGNQTANKTFVSSGSDAHFSLLPSHACPSCNVLSHTPHSHRCNHLSLSELVGLTRLPTGMTLLLSIKGEVWCFQTDCCSPILIMLLVHITSSLLTMQTRKR